MSTRRINLCLQLTAAVLALVAVLSLVAGLMVPVDAATVSVPVQRTVTATSKPASAPTVESFAPVFARSFQAPPATATPTAVAAGTPAVPAAAPPPPDPVIPVARLTLVGTLGESQALIRGPDGTVAIVEPGDDLEGATVLTIRPSQVDVRQNGKVLTLRKPPPPDDRGLISEPLPQP